MSLVDYDASSSSEEEKEDVIPSGQRSEEPKLVQELPKKWVFPDLFTSVIIFLSVGFLFSGLLGD